MALPFYFRNESDFPIEAGIFFGLLERGIEEILIEDTVIPAINAKS